MNFQRDLFLERFNSIDFEKIIDHPNILIAANFWDPDRFCAAKACYRFMRSIDDLIDNHKAQNKLITADERNEFISDVENWLSLFINSGECAPMQTELKEIIERFRIPMWPMEAFARSMIYDINNDGFATIDDFLEYSNGASVAPASVFVHLNGLRKVNGHYENPAFSVKWASTPCAIFSYLVHIIRDFQKDQLNNLSYFADDLILQNGLTRKDLRDFAEGKPVNDNFRNMVNGYYLLAGKYRTMTYNILKDIRPLLEPCYQLSLEIIFDLYKMVYERIDVQKGTFMTSELNPSAEETRNRVYNAIMNFKAA